MRVPSWRAINCATDTAAMRRGWVTPIILSLAKPAASRICGIWVVLPEPVGLCTTTTWLAATAARIRSFSR